MGKLIFFLSLMVLANMAWSQTASNSLTTDPPSGAWADTTAFNEVEPETTTASGDGQPETTEAAREQDTTVGNDVTDVNIEEDAEATELNKDVENTTNLPEPAPQVTTEPPPAVCSTVGLQQPDEKNCQQYYECSAEGSEDGSLHFVKKSCPENKAYSSKLKRCSRDIGSCPLEVTCLHEGALADPAASNSYYFCQKYYTGEGFHLFHVKCEPYQIYMSTIGKCYIDMTQPFVPPPFPNSVRDIDEVKAELKLIKEEYKFKLKEIKEKEKAEKKLEKEKEKQAKQQAKMAEKLRKEQAKQEAASFMCEKAGNVASKVADNMYIECIIKKDTFKAVSRQCIGTSTFNPETGFCVASASAKINPLASDEEDDD